MTRLSCVVVAVWKRPLFFTKLKQSLSWLHFSTKALTLWQSCSKGYSSLFLKQTSFLSLTFYLCTFLLFFCMNPLRDSCGFFCLSLKWKNAVFSITRRMLCSPTWNWAPGRYCVLILLCTDSNYRLVRHRSLNLTFTSFPEKIFLNYTSVIPDFNLCVLHCLFSGAQFGGLTLLYYFSCNTI